MRLLVSVLVTLLLLAPVARAQNGDPPVLRNPLAKDASAKNSAGTATRFKPSGSRLTLDAYVNGITEDADERRAFREALEKMLTAYEQAAKAGGFENDVAGAYTFAIAQYWSIWKGVDVSDKASEMLLKQMRAALDTPEIAKLSNTDKQKLYEQTLLVAFTIAITQEAAAQGNDATAKENVRKTARLHLEKLLGSPPEGVRLTDRGLEGAGGGGATPPNGGTRVAPAGSLDSVLAAYALPKDWETKTYPDGTVIASALVNDSDGRKHSCEIRLLAPRPAASGAAKAFQGIWKETLADFKAGSTTIAYRRVFPCGAVGHYMGGFYRVKNGDAKMYVLVYALDLGNSVLPIVASVLPGKSQGDYGYSALGESAAVKILVGALSPMIDSIKLKRVPPAPTALFSRADVEGYWTESSSSMVIGGYYVTSSGAYAGEMMSSFGMIMHLNPDKTFYYRFVYANRGARDVGQDKNEGTWTLSGDLLNLNPKFVRSYKYRYRVVGAGFIDTDKGPVRALVLRGADSQGNFELPPYFPDGKSWTGPVSWLTQTTKDRK